MKYLVSMFLLNLLFVSCGEGDPVPGDLSGRIGLVRDFGPVEVDGCGWQVQIDTVDYYAPDLPDLFKVNQLFIVGDFEFPGEVFTCFGGSTFPYVEVDEPFGELVRVYRNQTQCSDPWDQSGGESDQETISSLIGFLKGISVHAAWISSYAYDEGFCEACSCGNGRRFQLLIDKSDKQRAMSRGFTPANEACGLTSPLERIDWLKDLKDELDQQNHPGNKIVQYAYLDQCVFLVESCYSCADAIVVVYDIDQNVLCQFGGFAGLNTCPDFMEEAVDKQILWVETD